MTQSCCHPISKPWYQNKIWPIVLILTAVIIASYFLSFLESFRISFFMYLDKVWLAILLGMFLGGVVDHFVPKEHISFVLAKNEKRTIFHAVGLGFFMSLCSHGILAMSMQIYKKGASTSAVIAFLLASPWANFSFTILMIGFFGLIKALYIIFVALMIAFTTGFIFQLLEKNHLVEVNPNTIEMDKDFSLIKDIQQRLKDYRLTQTKLREHAAGIGKGMIVLSEMILWWLIIGISIASVLSAYVPSEYFHRFMGPTVLGMISTLTLATLIEVCSECTAPVAFEIFRQTGALGNSLVFLMAGVATDYTEIGLIWQNIGRKSAVWLPLLTIPQIIFWGIIANLLF